jgi:acetate kinase
MQAVMKTLILNCGSSSVKFQLIRMGNELVLAKGIVEKIGSSDAVIVYEPKDKNKIREIREVLNQETAIEIVLSMLLHPQHGVIQSKDEIKGIGHRVVHGGEKFSESVLITEQVKSAIREFIQFAPLHNPHNLKGIEACEKILGNIPQVAVFDTAFHQTIPPKAYLYGLPYALYRKLGIRRYGFHGTSHRYVAMKAAELLNRPLESLKLITCHLGNGASITAIDGGKSVDTSMGFTPLEGLVMGTRCGNVDPALVPYIMDHEHLTTKQIDSIMNKNSGMLGLSETTNDMREIQEEANRGSQQHQIALEVYCHVIKKYIGSYMIELGRVDAIVFTGGVGENSAEVRARVLSNLDRFDIEVDPRKNKKNALDVSAGNVKVLVIPTNEELAIARDTKKILQSRTVESETVLPKKTVTPEVSSLNPDEKRKLILLWAKQPNGSLGTLVKKMNRQIDRVIPEKMIKQELEKMGLIDMSKSKR